MDLVGHIVSNNTEVRSPTQAIGSYTYKRGRPTQLLQPQGGNHKNLQELRTPATGRVPSEPINVNLDCVSTLHQPFKGVHCGMNNLAFSRSDQSRTTQVHERDDYTLQVEEREESTCHLERGIGRDNDPWETDRKQQEWQTTERNGTNLRLYGASRECLATPQQPDQKDEHPQQMTRVENSIYLQQSLAGNFNTQRRIEQMSIGSDNSHLRLDDKRLQKTERDETHLDLYGASRESLATPQQITQEGTTTNQPTYTQGNTYKGPEAIQHHSTTNQTHFLSKGRANTETSHQTPTFSIMNHQLQREDTYRANPWMMHQVLTTCHPRGRNTIPRMIDHTQNKETVTTFSEGHLHSNIKILRGRPTDQTAGPDMASTDGSGRDCLAEPAANTTNKDETLINISTYNMQGFNSNKIGLHKLLETQQIICIQETLALHI